MELFFVILGSLFSGALGGVFGGYLFQTFTTASGQYLGDKYTDRRREKEAEAEKQRQFKAFQKEHPELIKEFRQILPITKKKELMGVGAGSGHFSENKCVSDHGGSYLSVRCDLIAFLEQEEYIRQLRSESYSIDSDFKARCLKSR